MKKNTGKTGKTQSKWFRTGGLLVRRNSAGGEIPKLFIISSKFYLSGRIICFAVARRSPLSTLIVPVFEMEAGDIEQQWPDESSRNPRITAGVVRKQFDDSVLMRDSLFFWPIL